MLLFHGAPGTPRGGESTLSVSSHINVEQQLGTHCLLDIFDCASSILDDEVALIELLAQAAERSGATVLARHHHRFEPHGVSALCLLAESHISIHTWPELGTATVDVYTCGDTTDPERACRIIIDALAPGHYDLATVQRGRMPAPTARLAR